MGPPIKEIDYDKFRQALLTIAQSMNRNCIAEKQRAGEFALAALLGPDDEPSGDENDAMLCHGRSMVYKEAMQAFDQLRENMERGLFDPPKDPPKPPVELP